MNQDLIDKRWKLTREELKKFRAWYKSQNKKTQDKIQEIINYYDITYNDLNKTIKPSDKKRLSRKIEEWRKSNIYKGYFKYRVEELNRHNINYRSLIEILLYSAFVEENDILMDEINNLFKEVAQDCYNQARNDLGKSENKISHSFFDNFSLILIDGIIFSEYLEALYLTHAKEIHKLYLSSIQQGKKLDTYSDFIQRQFEKQQNQLICINENKFSGGLDKYVTALGNMAYFEASDSEDIEVKFVSDHCENVTDMCSYMDGMRFKTKKRNIFKRPYGDTIKDLSLQEMDVIGLIVGINMPPISHHFHWCHSIITYQIDERIDELKYFIFEDEFFEEFDKLDKTREHLIYYDLETGKIFGKVINGEARRVTLSPLMRVKIQMAKKDSLIAVHNHPSNASFSLTDFQTFNNSKELAGIAVRTDDYIYLLSVGKGSKLKPTINNMKRMKEIFNKIQNDMKMISKNKTIETVHLRNKAFAKEMGWKYGRIRNNKSD